MRKIFLIIVSIQMLSLVSCTDMLDKQPMELYRDQDLLTSVEGLNTLLNGTYSIVQGSSYYGALIYQFEAAKGVDFFVRDVTGGTSMTSECLYSSSSTSNGAAASSWTTIYSVVTNTNLILDHIDQMTGNISEIRRIKGEALALRGLAYFDLLRLFAYPPHFSIPGAEAYDQQFQWGVPLITTSEQSLNIEKYQIRRSTAKDSYLYVLDQFRAAKMFLEGKPDKVGHVNSATASALLIRLYLYMERWDDVVAEGEEWIRLYGNNYSMLSYSNYPLKYYAPDNIESIWELGYNDANSLGSNSLNHWVRKPTDDDPTSPTYGQVVKNTGYARLPLQYGHTNRGLDLLNYYPNDIRRVLICEMGIPDHPEYRGYRKYVGNPFHSTHNIPIVRLPEIYLSLAEGYFKMSDPVKAADMASVVSQARRKAAITGANINDIYAERRREFMLEGHNYFDMYRTGRNISNRQIIECSDDSSINFSSITSQNYRTVYPIPLKEMNANPAIRDQQNPGYAAWVPGGEE